MSLSEALPTTAIDIVSDFTRRSATGSGFYPPPKSRTHFPTPQKSQTQSLSLQCKYMQQVTQYNIQS